MLRFYCKILQKAIEQRQNFRLRQCTFSGYQKILHYLDNYIIHSKEDSHSPTPQRVKPGGCSVDADPKYCEVVGFRG